MPAMEPNKNFWKSRQAVGVWLLIVAVVILGMIAVGGLTRLTGSGLSITQWDPIIGAIPPLTHAQWMDAFHKYQKIPQYLLENQGMTLAGFKGIFWWEWTHRLLGRILGFIFLLPFLWFAFAGAIKKSDWPRMLLLFVLGGLQGFIGWWMVSSGLEVRVSVSQYRLAIHLGTALLLLIAMIWIGLEYLRGPAREDEQIRKAGNENARRGYWLVGLVYCQMLLGALVAGLHAGLIYNTWPDMNGRVFPESPFFSSPWWINFFQNDGLAQFDHRIGAYIVAGFVVFIYAKGIQLTGMAKTSAKLVAAITAVQIGLGIATLLLVVPEALAAAHQITAALLLSACVWHAFELKRRADGVYAMA
jgi:cytochrome c oxidase assembly protein subunit 15